MLPMQSPRLFIKGSSSILSCNRCYGLRPLMTALFKRCGGVLNKMENQVCIDYCLDLRLSTNLKINKNTLENNFTSSYGVRYNEGRGVVQISSQWKQNRLYFKVRPTSSSFMTFFSVVTKSRLICSQFLLHEWLVTDGKSCLTDIYPDHIS